MSCRGMTTSECGGGLAIACTALAPCSRLPSEKECVHGKESVKCAWTALTALHFQFLNVSFVCFVPNVVSELSNDTRYMYVAFLNWYCFSGAV